MKIKVGAKAPKIKLSSEPLLKNSERKRLAVNPPKKRA